MDEIFNGVWRRGNEIYTLNAVPGKRVYGEKLIRDNGKEYRRWDPYRSKLAAAILKGLKAFPFKDDSTVLYLGASTGTTVSHLSDICLNGVIFAVEVAPQMMEKLMVVAEDRENIVPILADARKPETYEDVGKVDILYQDVAQPDQVRIFVLNAEKFLKNGGDAFIALKTHSIDVTKSKEETLEAAKAEIEKSLTIRQVVDIAPYDAEHYFIHAVKE